MSQGDQNVANASGATVRADINAELQALASLSSGASAPGTTYPNQLWVDTTNSVVRRRDNANSAWMIVDTMDTDRVLSKSTGYTLLLRDVHKLVLGDTTSAGFALTLPAVATAGEGFRLEVKNTGTGANALTLDGNASETINGSTTLALADGESAIVWCDGTAWQAIVLPTASSLTLPRGYISGLTLSNNGTDGEHDIDIAVGECRDSSDAFDMTLASTMTKRIDAAWAAGSGEGGLFTGTVANATWYHVFLIRKISDGSIDAGFDTSVTAGNIPTGYAAYRYLGSVLTNGSANIIGFSCDETDGGGARFTWTAPVEDWTGAASTGSRTLRTVSVPPGRRARWLGQARHFAAGSNHSLLITSPQQDDVAATGLAGAGGSWGAANAVGSGNWDVMTNTSSQVGARASVALTEYGTTYGWIDSRR